MPSGLYLTNVIKPRQTHASDAVLVFYSIDCVLLFGGFMVSRSGAVWDGGVNTREGSDPAGKSEGDVIVIAKPCPALNKVRATIDAPRRNLLLCTKLFMENPDF